MADDDVWQCVRHPSKWRRSGVCPICLHERLSSLCPDCAGSLPCSCSSRAVASPSSSSSSSSSFSLFSYPGDSTVAGDAPFTGIGSLGRVASLIECEPAFRRSKSMAVPFSGSSNPDPDMGAESGQGRSKKIASFWRLFRGNKGEAKTTAEMMRKSRSVAVSDAGEARFSAAAAAGKGKGWYFPSPIKVFRQARVTKPVFHQRSPLYRG